MNNKWILKEIKPVQNYLIIVFAYNYVFLDIRGRGIVLRDNGAAFRCTLISL